MAKAAKRTKPKSPTIPFNKRLILNHYILSLFEEKDFNSLSESLKSTELEGWDDERVSYFHHQLVQRTVQREHLSSDMLRLYDENIVSHTIRISQRRGELIKWKYFQYLSLLFTELYLDRYFHNHKELLDNLNRYLTAFAEREDVNLSPYTEDDLRKLAFWNATGSGKTLLMHVNLLQYMHYHGKDEHKHPINRIMLLTPSEDLSRQHEQELKLSGFNASLFDKDLVSGDIFSKEFVTIIDIHKLKDEAKDKTVAVDSFESNNLVLVDEGHRGSSGEEWKSKRDQLCKSGFSFEYSATFGQAISGNRDLEEEYAKCILFDYSYRYFYRDGYGKDFQILNLADDSKETVLEMYLTACLLTFYQQLKVFQEHAKGLRSFLIEQPLCVFVGGSVNAVRTSKGQQVSDVTDILLFISRFVREESTTIAILDRLLDPKPELLDEKGREIFRNRFNYILENNLTGRMLYHDILETVFNVQHAGAMLHVVNLKGVDGEIALRMGDNEPFGVINVGDAGKLCTLCESYEGKLHVTEQAFSDSYFHRLNQPNSKIKMLIGSKKFTEGWNSWRVSTMGLMNIGKKEGSLIIQLFGRGVRLKGYDMSLKRSAYLAKPELTIPPYLKWLETLNVFGIKAEYIQQFKEFLEEEGVKTDNEPGMVTLKATADYSRRNIDLKTLRLKDHIDFKKQGPRPSLGRAPEDASLPPVIVNWYPKIQSFDSKVAKSSEQPVVPDQLETGILEPQHLAFIDVDKLYFQLQKYKYERSWYNLALSRQKLEELLGRSDWYTLYIPSKELTFNDFRKVALWEELLLTLLKKYCEQYYHYCKQAWEAPYLEYRSLTEDDNNFIKEYRVYYDTEDERLGIELNKLKKQLENSLVDDHPYLDLRVFSFKPHLYHPLVYLGSNMVEVRPAPLNDGEFELVKDLQRYYQDHPAFFKDKELHLLRNRSRGKGIGFFEAGNFYPDFILWILYQDKQYISFIDPKGLKHHSLQDKKMQFHRKIKEMEAERGDSSIILNSFIVSGTAYDALSSWGQKLSIEELKEHHIFFQLDENDTYIKDILNRIINS